MVIAALAAAAPAPAQDQSQPEAPRALTLAVRVHALIQGNSDQVVWQDDRTQFTLPSKPVGIKIQGEGSNIVVLVQVTPFDREDSKITLMIQGQVWMRRPEGGLSYRTRLDTVTVGYGETVLFYPLGVESGGKAPLLVEIVVTREGGTEKPKK